ncbi:MAG TPA: hypothetical protein VEZ90_19445 [Blastocatellia bacterium]|nr:hypothetical protein [Blastocatellia bacterium]
MMVRKHLERLAVSNLADLEKRILGLSEEDLVRMLGAESSHYRREALNFATEELRRRGFEVRSVGTDFDIVTPDHVILLPSNNPAHGGSSPLLSFAKGPGGISTWAYAFASVSGVIVPILLLVIAVFVDLALVPKSESTSVVYVSTSVQLSEFLFFIIAPLAAILLSYFSLGVGFGYKWPGQGWRWGLWIAVPAAILAFASLASAIAPSLVMGITGFAVLSLSLITSACLGAAFGSWRKRKKLARGPNSLGPHASSVPEVTLPLNLSE